MRQMIGHLSMVVACGGLLASLGCGGSALRFVNESDAPIAGLYLAAVGERTWGPNHIGGSPLYPGDTQTVTHIECDHFDVRIVDLDGTECILENEFVCMERTDFVLTESDIVSCQAQTSGGEAPASLDSTITFVNASPTPIQHLQLAEVGERTWGPDHLGGAALQAGDSHTIVDVECAYFDVLITDPDGVECILENVDICGEDAQFVLTNEDLLQCQGR